MTLKITPLPPWVLDRLVIPADRLHSLMDFKIWRGWAAKPQAAECLLLFSGFTGVFCRAEPGEGADQIADCAEGAWLGEGDVVSHDVGIICAVGAGDLLS